MVSHQNELCEKSEEASSPTLNLPSLFVQHPRFLEGLKPSPLQK